MNRRRGPSKPSHVISGELIDILRKYGIIGLLGGGALGGAVMQADEEVPES